MTKYSWVANEMKLRRAEAKCGQGATEDQVKAEYIKLGGLVIETPEEAEVGIETQEEKKKVSKK